MRQTERPLCDPDKVDRIKMSKQGTCQVNSMAKYIAAFTETVLCTARAEGILPVKNVLFFYTTY